MDNQLFGTYEPVLLCVTPPNPESPVESTPTLQIYAHKIPNEKWNADIYKVCSLKVMLVENGFQLLLRPFPYLGSADQVFNLHVLQCCASSIFTRFSFMSSYNITSPQFSSVPIFRGPSTSICHALITTSS